MRRFLGVLVLAALAAGVLSGAALAKEKGVELSSTPVGLEPGEPWTPKLFLLAGPPELFADAQPGVTIRNVETGERRTFPARPTNVPLEYDVRVVFPEAGWYTVEAFGNEDGRSYPIGGQWLVDAPNAAPGPAAPAPAAGDESPFPVWPVAAGGSLLLLLLAAGAALLLRRQRLGLSH
jgi:hypothetical protein